MQVSSRSRSKGEIVNRKQQGVLRDCEWHEEQWQQHSEVKRPLVDSKMGVVSNVHVEW